MANGNERKRISDIITEEEIMKWQPGDNILISAPMGAGKSYFCKNSLYEIAKGLEGKILMLLHRANCVEQFKSEIEQDAKEDIIDIRTYQSIEQRELHKSKNQIQLANYMYAVSDEFHYYFNDSSFNNKTAVSFKKIVNDVSMVHIFMSATGDHMSKYMKKYIQEHGLKEPIEYKLPDDFSFMNDLTFFYKDESMEDLIKAKIKTGEKGIFFIQSAEKAYKLYKKYSKNCLFNCSSSNKKYYQYVDKEKISELLERQQFDEDVLITTSCFDAGINIIDRNLKYMVIDLVDVCSLIQCMGRKRIQDAEDKLDIYIHAINNQKLAGLKRSTDLKIKMADVYIKSGYSMEKLLKEYPMQNDMNNILYDEIVSAQDGSISYRKVVNELMYFKKKEDIEEYDLMINMGKFGYCMFLAKKFGFYNEETERYTYSIMKENQELEDYLEKLANDGTIFLQRKDRSDLINKINAKQNGQLLKKWPTLNQVLDERGIDYRIKDFPTTRYIQDDSGNKKKRIHKHAWKIVKF